MAPTVAPPAPATPVDEPPPPPALPRGVVVVTTVAAGALRVIPGYPAEISACCRASGRGIGEREGDI